jgi:hypothetical protein
MINRLVSFCLASSFALPLAALTASAEDVPLHLSLRECRVSVCSVVFAKRIDGIDGNYVSPKEPDKFRVAFVTVRVDKPAGRELTVAACDLSLHYKHGTQLEATICEGMSQFSMGENDERAMKLPQMTGPGFVKQTTGPKAAQSETVYFDCVFAGIEPDIGDVWLFVGQPVSTTPISTNRWTP